MYYDEEETGFSHYWEGEITVAYGIQRHGWVLCAILSTALYKSHVISISNIFSPFKEMYDWLAEINNGNNADLFIDEEGIYTAIKAKFIDKKKIEILVKQVGLRSEDFDHESALIAGVYSANQIVEEFTQSTLKFLLSCPNKNTSGWLRDEKLIELYRGIKLAND